MSLSPIYLCCDDLKVYKLAFITGDGWWIELLEFKDDALWIPAAPREKFEPRSKPRPLVKPQQVIDDNDLPIASVTFLRHGDWKGQEVAVYAIQWNGKAFPRRLLEAWRQPSNCRIPGTMACYTKHHRHLLQGTT